MLKDKCIALNELGFNYLTRNMDGEVIAWMNKPVRVVYCLEDQIVEAKRIYGETATYMDDYYDEETEYKYENGVNINLSSFGCSKEDDKEKNMYRYGHLALPNDKVYDAITWMNSPVRIQDIILNGKENQNV